MDAKQIADWSNGIFGWVDGQVGGWRTYTHEECYQLAKAGLETVPEGGMIMEIGTYTGLSSAVLLQVAREKKARIALIDMFMWNQGFEKGEVEAKMRSVLCQFPDVWWRMYWTSSEVATKIAAASCRTGGVVCPPFIDHNIDYMHIDGDHMNVKGDCELWFHHLKDKCAVAFHDANPDPRAPIGNMVVADALKWTEGWREMYWTRDDHCLMIRGRG